MRWFSIIPCLALCACPAKKILVTSQELSESGFNGAIEIFFDEPNREFEVLGVIREPLKSCGSDARAFVEREYQASLVAWSISLRADALLVHIPHALKCPGGSFTAYAIKLEEPGTLPPPPCPVGKGVVPLSNPRSCVKCPMDAIERKLREIAREAITGCMANIGTGYVRLRFDVGMFGEVMFPTVMEDTTKAIGDVSTEPQGGALEEVQKFTGAATCLIAAIESARFDEADGGLCRVEASFHSPEIRVSPR